ncbi:HAD family hydrolase [Pseudomonas sp. N040]|uniref:HAD family hydrolase n=1 Tax=Pseudomonas sp. N040 TaxID=2785325 RepID=UPI0018A25234|nr:HAD family hydrolase [Pseudomonas sp. N040]MBF7731089.1 HAD family hydrolase [Pseudomonas sp. N040]MBW7014732.1 HAD family hydrolase [Pseudomonas sp. N040]
MRKIRFVCLDWGSTLMSEAGPQDLPMCQWPQVRVIDGARELLAALAAEYPLCIASNASLSRRGEIEQALARGDLLQYISQVFCFSEIGAQKSERAFWEVVTRTLGCSTSEIAMLGDSLEQDVLGPASHGVFAVWFNPQAAAVPPGTQAIRRLEDFIPLLRDAG